MSWRVETLSTKMGYIPPGIKKSRHFLEKSGIYDLEGSDLRRGEE